MPAIGGGAHANITEVVIHCVPQRLRPVADDPDVDGDERVAGRAGDGEGVPLPGCYGRNLDEDVLSGTAAHVIICNNTRISAGYNPVLIEMGISARLPRRMAGELEKPTFIGREVVKRCS